MGQRKVGLLAVVVLALAIINGASAHDDDDFPQLDEEGKDDPGEVLYHRLNTAIHRNDVNEAREAIEAGASVLQVGDHDPFLVSAAGLGSAKMVKFLLDNGANPNEVTSDGTAPIIAAAFDGHMDVCIALLEGKADVNIESHDQYTAVEAAVLGGHHELAQYLESKGGKKAHHDPEEDHSEHVDVHGRPHHVHPEDWHDHPNDQVERGDDPDTNHYEPPPEVYHDHEEVVEEEPHAEEEDDLSDYVDHDEL